jgi:hypothetical protein
MDRRTFLCGLTVGGLSASLALEAQQPVKVHKVGLLSPPPGEYVPAFEESLRLLGYVRGSNILFETRSPGGTGDLLPRTVAELLRLNVEVIVTGPNRFMTPQRRLPVRSRSSWCMAMTLLVEATSHPWRALGAISLD